MDSKTVDRAMRDRLPVIYDGKRYDYIHESVSWYDGTGRHSLSVGLLQGGHLYRVDASKVELAEEVTV